MAQQHILLLVASLSVLIRCQHCPSYEVGAADPASLWNGAEELRSNRVFVNINDAAECNGTVYGWRVCPLRTEDDDDDDESSFQVVLAMYRYSSEVDAFFMVDGSYHELRLREDEIEYGECFDHMLNNSAYFDVEEGDRVAACWQRRYKRIELAVERQNYFLLELEVDSCYDYDSVDHNYDDVADQTILLSAFINIDECAFGQDKCHEKATCSDVVGGDNSYNCTCSSGYTGDGFSCVGITDIDVREDERENTTGVDEGRLVPNITGNESIKNGTNGTPQDSPDKEEQGTGGIVGATVAAVFVVLSIVVVIGVLVVLYLSRQRMERVFSKLTGSGFGRGSTKKHTPSGTTLATPEGNGQAHEYDYITPEQRNHYELIHVTPDVPLSDKHYERFQAVAQYEVPIGSQAQSGAVPTPHSLDNETEMGNYVDTGYSIVGKYNDYTSLIQQTVQEHIYEALSPYKVPATRQESLYAQLSSYGIKTIQRNNIQILSRIGTGQFGSVSMATWSSEGGVIEVAVKILTDSSNTVRFLQEAAIMAQFRHPNILALYMELSKILVVELMHNGDLRSVVCNMRPSSGSRVVESVPFQLLTFSKHVALGLHYLACRGFIHRDLAARNILVSNENICKIADFGLSRDLAEDDIYVSHGGKIPLKWSAPEAIFRRKNSTASDVWSYGCVLYEIWSLGHKPFETHDSEKVAQLVKDGYRLPPPPGCPKKIYQLMIDTWHPDMMSRPQPRDVLKALMGDAEETMAVPPEDVPAGSQAAVLGAPLDAATHLYHTLQKAYIDTME